MNSMPLTSGQTYKQGPNGEPILVQAADLPEVPAAELAPDLRPPEMEAPNADKAKGILDDLAARVQSTVAQIKADAAKPKVNVTENDRYAFLKAMINGKSYHKQYSLFGGKLKATFKTITTAESEAITEALVIQSGRVPFSNVVAMGAAHMKYSLTCCLTEIRTETDEGIVLKAFKSPLKTYPDTARVDSYYTKEDGNLVKRSATLAAVPGQKVLWAAAEGLAEIEIPIYNLLFNTFQRFDELVAELAKEAVDPDFFLNGVDGR